MGQVRLTGNVNHDGTTYLKGEVFKGDSELLQHFVAIGVAELEEAPETSPEAPQAKEEPKTDAEPTEDVKAAEKPADAPKKAKGQSKSSK